MAKRGEEITAVPMTPLMESLRRFIAWSTGVPAIHRLFAGVYDAAVRGLVREVASLPGTVSVLSRNSYPARSFTPGLSDLDVMVILEDGLEASKVQSILEDLYRVCARLRRRFPMLNPFPVYTREGFLTALELGPPRSGTYAWRCEWGDDGVLAGLEEADPEPSVDGPTRGAQIYLRWFHQNLRMALEAGKTRSTLALERSARQISRASEAEASSNGRAGKGRIPAVVADLLAKADAALEPTQVESSPPPWKTIAPDGERLGDVDLPMEGIPSGIDSVVAGWEGPALWVLLSVPVTEEAVARAVELARSRPQGVARTTFLTERLFVFFLRQLNPMVYYGLMSARRVRGVDVLESMLPPSEEGIRRFFAAESARLLRLPLHLGSGRQPPAGQLVAHRRRRDRLIHLLEQDELLLEDRDADMTVEQLSDEQTLLDMILEDMPGVLERLRERPRMLFNE